MVEAEQSSRSPIVVDFGGSNIKCKTYDDDYEAWAFVPNIEGMPIFKYSMPQACSKKYYIGDDARRIRGVLDLKCPLKNGVV